MKSLASGGIFSKLEENVVIILFIYYITIFLPSILHTYPFCKNKKYEYREKEKLPIPFSLSFLKKRWEGRSV